jgi:arylsulfatase A-like enzyme
MKSILYPFSVLLFLASLVTNLQAAERPNVIIIYTDDQGTVDLSCYGTTDIHTPHIDSLASRGVRFKQMYSPSAICSASRAGLMTGRFPPRAGVPGNVSSEEGVAGMPTGQFTLAEMMKDAGYATTTLISFSGKAPTGTTFGATANISTKTAFSFKTAWSAN